MIYIILRNNACNYVRMSSISKREYCANEQVIV